MKSCCKEGFEEQTTVETESKKGFLLRLKHRWNVKNILQVVLILFTFAIGGSLCGYAGRKLLQLFDIEHRGLWVTLYVITVCILWPLCVLLISIPLGQFRFFTKYLSKLGRRIFRR